MRSRRTMLFAVGAAAAMMLAGCGSSSSDGADQDAPTGPATVTVTTAAPEATAAPPQTASAPPQATTAGAPGLSPRTADAVRALDTATKAVPNGRPYDLERDDHRGERVWEIKVAGEGRRAHELLVSIDGSRVVHRSRDDDDDDDTAKVRAARVTMAAALQTADRRVGGDLDDAEIDREDGTIAWKVTFEETARDLEHEVLVDAVTGEVIRVETDDDD